jgi:hypothetical protein
MKKIVITAAIMFCVMNTNAQTRNYIKRDTIEILTYDSLGNEYHYNPPRIIIKRTEMGDPEYWKRKHKRERIWNRISLGLFTIGTVTMFLITKK